MGVQFSPVFYYYTMNPIPDNLALCAIIWSLRYFFQFRETQNWRFAYFSSIFFCLSVSAKLPFIVLGGIYFCYI
ncbi:MAG: hypothetical protein HC817_01800 [Saprospiraceae bacterium]|nr:hypothetical protein [Saprospiraceae bacterium]